MRRSFASALVSLLLLPVTLVFAAGKPPVGVPARVGEVVRPNVVDFSSLPRVTVPYSGPVLMRPEGVKEDAEEMVEELKRNPRPPRPADLTTLTIDSNVEGAFSAQAPTVSNGFEGITQGPFIPSEPAVAAGPLNIFTTGNVSVTVTDKGGANRVETNGKTFFGVPASEGEISDAQCYYDALRGRFVALCFTQGTSPSNYSNFYLVMSQTNDARGQWWQYKFDMTKDGTTQTSNWSDYQALGISDDKIAMTGQQFTFGGNAYRYQKIRIIDRAAAYSGASVTYVDFANFAAPPGGDTNDNFVTKAARNLTAGDNTIHCLCIRVSSGSRVTYRTVTGPPSAPVLSAGNLVTVSAYSAPPNAPQLGSGTLVSTNDCRPGDFYVRNGVLTVAWHTSAAIGGTVSAIRLLRLRTSDRAVLTDETFGAAGTFCYYPAVTVDSVGTIFLGFDRSSASEYPSSYATGKRRGDATLQPSVLLKAGLSPTAQSRWGDYTGIDNDASLSGPAGSTAWYAGQWTKGTNTFGTWINRLTFSYGQVAGAVLDDCDGNAATGTDRALLAGVTLTLKQGVTVLGTTTSDASGTYNFGYLETGTYDVVVTPPAGGSALDAFAGYGGNSQTRISVNDLQASLTNEQTSAGNIFLVTSTHVLPATSYILPATKNVGDPTFSMTVSGSGFTVCSVVRLDGADRATTYVDPNQLTAEILASDMASGITRAVTVFTPAPGGGTSNAQTFSVNGAPDTEPPVATLTSPVGGESWPIGSVHDITWNATDDIGVTGVDLAYSTDGGATYPNVIASAIPNSGTFAWTVPGLPSATARVRVTAMDAGNNSGEDASDADFSITGWTIMATAGPNGSVTPPGTVGVGDGATPSYTITPDAGFAIADVLVNGISVGAVAGYTFPAVHENQTISATFVALTYTLNVNVVGNGTVDRTPDLPTYGSGASVSLTATPAGGWTFAGWSGDASGAANPLAVTMDANKDITATFTLHVYTWNQTVTAAWSTAANWTPVRTTPATDDVLIFDGGGSVTATGVPTQTIAQLRIANGTSVALQPSSSATLSLIGGAGTDLELPAGCTLTLNGANGLTIALGAGATGDLGGFVDVSGGAHRLMAASTDALMFLGGSRLTTGAGFSGSVFGTGGAPGALNSVVFEAGSLLSHGAGANPFGASAPNSVVTFQPGSRFRLDGLVTPSMAGRAYADFEFNISATASPTGSTGFTMDSLIVTQGTLNLNLAGGGTIRGNIAVASGATLTLSPTSGTPTFTLGGSSPQTVDIQGSFSTNTVARVAIANASGVTLATNVTLGGTLSFTSGRISTGAHVLSITSTGSVSGASQSAGYVDGQLRRNFASGASSRTFDVGDAAIFAPVVVALSGAGSAFDVTAATGTPDHLALGSSGLDVARSVNRTWTLTPSGSPVFTEFDATFNFASSDLDVGTNTANLQIARYDGAWSATTIGTRTATSTKALAVTGFGEFAIAQLPFTITSSAGSNGTIAPLGAVSVSEGASQAFTISPDAGYHVADVLVDGLSVGAVPDHTFANVTADHTIAASFALDEFTLAVGTVGGGTVTLAPIGASFSDGTSVLVTAVPDPGWEFSGWSGDTTETANPITVVVNRNRSFTATFADVGEPTVGVTAPNGGEFFHLDEVAPFTWTASDNAGVTNVDLLLSRDGPAGPFDMIGGGLPNSGTYDWTVTGPLTTTALLKVVAHDAAGNSGSDVSDAEFSISITTGVEGGAVTEFELAPVWPNPVHRTGRVHFALPHAASIRLSVMDVQGREVLVLAEGMVPAGRHEADLNGERGAGRLGTGLYFLRYRTPERTITRRFVLTR